MEAGHAPVPHRPAGRRPRPARRRARRRQDDAVQDLRPRPRHAVPAHPVHARPAAVRRDRHLHLRPQAERVRAAQGADLLPGAAGRRGQPRPRQDAVGPAGGDAGKPGHHRGHDACRCRGRSWCWPRRTRSSRRASTACRRRSSTASCCASRWAIPAARAKWPCCSCTASPPVEVEPALHAGPDPGHAGPACRDVYGDDGAAGLHRRPGRGEPDASRRGAGRQPAGVAVPAALRPRPRPARRPALLHARGRAGRRAWRAGPSPHHPARGGGRGQARRATWCATCSTRCRCRRWVVGTVGVERGAGHRSPARAS